PSAGRSARVAFRGSSRTPAVASRLRREPCSAPRAAGAGPLRASGRRRSSFICNEQTSLLACCQPRAKAPARPCMNKSALPKVDLLLSGLRIVAGGATLLEVVTTVTRRVVPERPAAGEGRQPLHRGFEIVPPAHGQVE